MRSGKPGAPPFVKSYLHALDRMQERETLRPEEVTQRARALLEAQFGVSEQPVEVAFCHTAVGLMSEHTHYFDGFALMMSLPFGTAVAVRRAGGALSHVLFEGGIRVWDFDCSQSVNGSASRAEMPVWTQVAQRIACQFAANGVQIEAAVVSTSPACYVDSYLAALAVAETRALQALFGRSDALPDLFAAIRDIVSGCQDRPLSIAYPLAADVGRPEALTLIDAATLEHLPLDGPSRDEVGWGLIDAGIAPGYDAAFARKRKEMADHALSVLRNKGFARLGSLRELEHQDLQRALVWLPRSLRPVLRYLVTENRRVQKLVVAVRQRDWQMFGALLIMSHAAQRSEWGAGSEEVDFVAQQVEAMSIEGMYGVCTNGRAGGVLAAGQPFIVPSLLDRVSQAFEQRFQISPDVMLL